MNVASAMGYQPPVAPTARIDDTDVKVDDNQPTDPATAAQFSALLAMLANNGQRARADVLRKANPSDVALLDRLLNGALVASAQPKTSSGKADAGTAATADTNAALDSVRYSMLNDLAQGVLKSLPTLNSTDVSATDRSLSGLTGAPKAGKSVARKDDTDARLQGLARALQSVKSPTRGLTRAAEVHGSSIEELMALGDTQGANVKSMLQALLDKAGTPEGALLANTDTMSGTTPTNAELIAFATALAAARSASAADVTTPITDTAALQPELRTKLDRVISRMQSEFGHDVQIVETARSPERQANLFAQGRTAPGDVVTWTLDSAHLRGAAADVVVDGKWNNEEGFAHLQYIAREEGLRTLGARDPGHLELMNSKDFADVLPDATVKSAATPANSAASGVAGVARVAGVASVAQVAVPTQATSARTDEGLSVKPDRTSVGAAIGALAQGSARTNDTANDAARDRARDGNRDAAHDGARGTTRDGKASSARDGAFPAYGDAQNATTSRNLSAPMIDRSQPAPGIDSAQRVADAQALRDDAPAKALKQMTLDVEGPGGDSQRITVDMRGNAVSTHIDTDALSADRLRARVGELQGALEQHGLQSDVVRITSAPARVADAAEQLKQATSAGERDALRLAGANGSTAGDGTSQQGLRDRPGAARDWEKHNDARNTRDEQRQGNSQRNRRGPNYEEL